MHFSKVLSRNVVWQPPGRPGGSSYHLFRTRTLWLTRWSRQRECHMERADLDVLCRSRANNNNRIASKVWFWFIQNKMSLPGLCCVCKPGVLHQHSASLYSSCCCCCWMEAWPMSARWMCLQVSTLHFVGHTQRKRGPPVNGPSSGASCCHSVRNFESANVILRDSLPVSLTVRLVVFFSFFLF